MAHIHPLDKFIGDTWPTLANDAEIREFETVPYDERIAAASTYEALQLGAACNPDAPALLYLPNADPEETPVRVTHREFLGRVTQAANLFTESGIGPNDVVSFLLPLVPQAFFTLFGAEAAGIANPVNPLLEPGQLAEILRAANTKVLVALGPVPGTDIWTKVERIRELMPELKTVFVVGGADDAARGVYNLDTAVARQPADKLTSGRRIASSDIAAYFHTGGTTGLPKLVRHTHANQVYQAWAMDLLLKLKPGSTFLFGLPLFHVGGALTQGLATLSGGGALVVLSPSGWRNPASIRNVWRLIERYRPEVFGGVPTVMAAALNVPVDGADVSSLRRAAGGGSAIPVPVGKAYAERFNIPVMEVYGMTETSSVHVISHETRPIRIGAVGHPVPYSHVRVVQLDEQDRVVRDCEVNEIGVITMSGPGVFSGYLNDKHNKGAFVEPGWVNSGDLGRLDEDGYLWVTGRAKDLIIRGGHNIDPMALEEVFFQHPAIALAAVVGQPDVYAGELPVAYVQLKAGVTADAAELRAFIAERTPERAAVPVNLYLVDSIPLTAVGKVFKPALRWDAAGRTVTQMLADLVPAGKQMSVTAGPCPVNGNLIKVRFEGVGEGERERLAQDVGARIGPLVWKHEVVWS
ncbi:acyl-CoA synthetase [Variovorax rhizosphaerae]|uniref:Acyl-CoA synthetase n=1 Tax=Variovorax rhizosphaerae TaxID=1836200 RepID=A0ABU8WKJ0_9BURK